MAEVDQKALYKKLNGKSSPLRSGYVNPKFSKFNENNGKKGKKAKVVGEGGVAEDDELGKQLRNEKAERNQNF